MQLGDSRKTQSHRGFAEVALLYVDRELNLKQI